MKWEQEILEDVFELLEDMEYVLRELDVPMDIEEDDQLFPPSRVRKVKKDLDKLMDAMS